MTTPRHLGSRVVEQTPNLIRIIQSMREEIRRARDATRPETLAFVGVAGVAATAASLTDVQMVRVYRSGDSIFADLRAATGASSVMAFRLSVPDLTVTGDTVTTAAGGTQAVRVTLAMPEGWEQGAAHDVFLQAQRVSGADSTTVAVMRAWQR